MYTTGSTSIQSQPTNSVIDPFTVRRKPIAQSNNSFHEHSLSYGPPAGGTGESVSQPWQPQQQQDRLCDMPSPPQSALPSYSGPQREPEASVQQQIYFPPPPTQPRLVSTIEPRRGQYQQPHQQQPPYQPQQPYQQQQPQQQPSQPQHAYQQRHQSTNQNTQPRSCFAQGSFPSSQAAPPIQNQTSSQHPAYSQSPTACIDQYRVHQPLPQAQLQPPNDRRATWSGSLPVSNTPYFNPNQPQQHSALQQYGQIPAQPHPFSTLSEQQNYFQCSSQPYQPQGQWSPSGPPAQPQQQQTRRRSTLSLPTGASVSVSGLTGKLAKFAQSKKAKKIMGLTGGLLVGSLIGSEIGDIGEDIGGFFEGAEEDAVGLFGSEEAFGGEGSFGRGEGGAGAQGSGQGGKTGGDAAFGIQQGPSAVDAGQDFMHMSAMSGISSMRA